MDATLWCPLIFYSMDVEDIKVFQGQICEFISFQFVHPPDQAADSSLFLLH